MDEDGFSPRTKPKKCVSIAESEHISPLIIGNYKDAAYTEDQLDLDAVASNKQYSAGLGAKRLQGRPNFDRSSSRSNLVETPLAPILDNYFATATSSSNLSESRPHSRHSSTNNDDQHFLAQVTAWVKAEKDRRHARREKKKAKKAANADAQTAMAPTTQRDGPKEKERRGSDSSDGSVALEHLTAILEKSMLAERKSRRSRGRMPSTGGHRLSGAFRSLRRKSTASDASSIDAEILVPNAEAVLDNSKTLSYSGGEAQSAADDVRKASTATTREREREAWSVFKSEIVRITHTLRLKGWKHVPRDLSDHLDVERLSGALTNAVYVVSPPKDLPKVESDDGKQYSITKSVPKLLLRIYGPQVEHLIDRESELQILRRLARKRIGPSLLGTFSNGRFEEYLYAKPLTPRELRDPNVSKQIAKRMRELHEGMELYASERESGPFVWSNWDKWLDRCEHIGQWCDEQLAESGPQPSGVKDADEAWRKRGPVCGTEWATFRKTVEKYRKWLNDQYGGEDKIKERLVFAHNDTQYGNILRMVPPGESPLLLPANVHKQLIVIDFEYASANLPGLEFANHFTEWCYNYHDETASHACNANMYPTPQEQHRFIRAYCVHRPTFSSVSTPPTPQLSAQTSTNMHRAPPSPDALRRPLTSTSSTSASNSGTDIATPRSHAALSAATHAAAAAHDDLRALSEIEAEKQTEIEIERLMAETRVWRLANSAQWVAWGLVQAKIKGMPEFVETPKLSAMDAMGGGEGGGEGDVSDDAITLDGNENVKEKKKSGSGVHGGVRIDVETPAQVAAHEEAVADKVMAGTDEEEEQEEEEAFDYLAYAQDRAWFFWGDAVRLGIVGLEELPEGVRGRIKIVDY